MEGQLRADERLVDETSRKSVPSLFALYLVVDDSSGMGFVFWVIRDL